jgi:hypothetical protein
MHHQIMVYYLMALYLNYLICHISMIHIRYWVHSENTNTQNTNTQICVCDVLGGSENTNTNALENSQMPVNILLNKYELGIKSILCLVK